MANKKEIALWVAFNLGHSFKQNMQVVRMSEDSLQELQIRHVCLPGSGFTMLQKNETTIQDYLKYYHVQVWGCPYCGKLYWYTEEVGQVLGDEAVMLRKQKKLLEMNGYSTQQIPNQSFYNVVMTEPDITVQGVDWGMEQDQDLSDFDTSDANNDELEDQTNELDKLNDINW